MTSMLSAETAADSPPRSTGGGTTSKRRRRRRSGAVSWVDGLLLLSAVLWLMPIGWAIFMALRPFAASRTDPLGVTGGLSFDNFVTAWTDAELPRYFLNALIIVPPAVVLTLLLAAAIGFAVSTVGFRFNIALLMLFTAGNLLPAQIIITPLYRMYLFLPLPPFLSDNGVMYDQYFGIIVIHTAFQVGFCAFVLSNYMRTIPREIVEAAIVDGAGLFRIFFRVILPLCRPALAALAALEFTWIYNDFFWALILIRTSDRAPITSALNNLKTDYFEDPNLLAAGALIVAIPTVLVFLLAQRHFVQGLTMGSTK